MTYSTTISLYNKFYFQTFLSAMFTYLKCQKHSHNQEC